MTKVVDIRSRAPADLSPEAQALWRDVIADFEVQDSAALAILRQACELIDLIRACQTEIAKDGLVVRGARKQPRPHPLLVQLAEARRGFLACCRALNLDLSPP